MAHSRPRIRGVAPHQARSELASLIDELREPLTQTLRRSLSGEETAGSNEAVDRSDELDAWRSQIRHRLMDLEARGLLVPAMDLDRASAVFLAALLGSQASADRIGASFDLDTVMTGVVALLCPRS
jgi:hypothetical protein